MSRKREVNYDQDFPLPPSLEEWVGPEHPARFIRAFVESLDLESAGIRWGSESLRGQPSHPAEMLLKIPLYARFLGIRGYRKMEAACKDPMGMLWLTGLLTPDHNTLWEFFKANKRSLRQVFKHSVQVALQADLIGLVLHALDGTKVQAAVANATGWHLSGLQERDAHLEQEHLRCYRCRRPDCPVRAQCSQDPQGRKIELGEHHAALQRQRDKLRDSHERAKLAKRRYIVEPVFGWIKQQLGFRRHAVFGLEGAQTEWSLIAAVYNLRYLDPVGNGYGTFGNKSRERIDHFRASFRVAEFHFRQRV